MNRVVVLLASAGLTVGLVVAASWESGRTAASAEASAARSTNNDLPRRATAPADLDLDSSPHRGRGRQFTPELVARILEVANEVRSPMADRLQLLCDQDPQEFERVLRGTVQGRRLVALADLKERDPGIYRHKMHEMQQELEIARLIEEIAELRRTGNAERERYVRVQLETAVRLQLAYSIAARGESINRLQQHLDAQREELARDARDFDANVKQRVEDVLAQAERAATESASAQRR